MSQHGITAPDVTSLVRRLSAANELVIEKGHPTVSRAAEYLGRCASQGSRRRTGGAGPGSVDLTEPPGRANLRRPARPDLPPDDLARLSAARRPWLLPWVPADIYPPCSPGSRPDRYSVGHPLIYRASVIRRPHRWAHLAAEIDRARRTTADRRAPSHARPTLKVARYTDSPTAVVRPHTKAERKNSSLCSDDKTLISSSPSTELIANHQQESAIEE